MAVGNPGGKRVRRVQLRDIVVDCARPSRLAAFWSEVLGYPVAPYDDGELERLRALGIDDVVDDPSVAIGTSIAGSQLLFVKVPEPKSVKNRLHFDLNLRSSTDIAWLVERGATARPLAGEPGDRWAVLADPEGNEFCVFPPDA